MYLLACLIKEAVRRWFWGIHLRKRLRVPPGFPRFPHSRSGLWRIFTI